MHVSLLLMLNLSKLLLPYWEIPGMAHSLFSLLNFILVLVTLVLILVTLVTCKRRLKGNAAIRKRFIIVIQDPDAFDFVKRLR